MAQRGMTEEEKEVCQVFLLRVWWGKEEVERNDRKQVFIRNITLKLGMFIINFHDLLFRN